MKEQNGEIMVQRVNLDNGFRKNWEKRVTEKVTVKVPENYERSLVDRHSSQLLWTRSN